MAPRNHSPVASYQQSMQNALGANPAADWQKQQATLAQMLFGAAQGNGPSAAQAQLQAGTDANVHNAMAMGQTLGGASPMAAYRAILQNQAMAQQQGANQAAQLRAQEQQGAQGMLGNLLLGGGQQAIGGFNATQGAAQGWGGLDLQKYLGAMQNDTTRYGIDQAMARQQAGQSWQGQQNDNALLASLFGGLLGAGGAAMTMGASGGAPGMAGGVRGGGNMAAFGAEGGLVGGQRAPGGNSYSKDTVPAMLTTGEVVLPLSVVNDENAEELAAEFVRAIKAKHRSKPA